MKQKIVIKVQMTCDKCRSKAMKIAAVADGVSSVAIEGADKDRVVVIGDGVDSVCLARLLRKKLGFADLVSVEEVKPKAEPKKDPPPTPCPPCPCPRPQYSMCEVVYDPNPTGCSKPNWLLHHVTEVW